MSKNKLIGLLGVLNLYLFVYIIILGTIGISKGGVVNETIFGNNFPVISLLFIMFILELLSTMTFQLRIGLTAKDKIILAASIGASSGIIAGIQGLFLISGDIVIPHLPDGLSTLISFLIKLPPVFIATFSGISINYFVNKVLIKPKKKESK